ncbi:MAG TPA: hypothetical protein VIV60_17235 [Polyangiaceae bacterium]
MSHPPHSPHPRTLVFAAYAIVGLLSAACGGGDDSSASNGGAFASAGAQSTASQPGQGGSASVGGSTAAQPGSGGAASTTTKSNNGGTTTGGSETSKFSFFVTSYKAMKSLSGSEDGFGGDLRYGTADGLSGADKICTEIAEASMPGNGKQWRAYLSTSAVNAIDRIGEGPWYDRRGRLFSATKANLLATRPIGADTAIINDLPNEDGIPNHSPDGTQVDNHDTLTGTNHLGTLYSATAHCTNWTSSATNTSQKPRVGHTWPRPEMVGRGGGTNSPGMSHWASALDESGCGAGVNLIETGAPSRDGVVGSGGGYGGIYCFALTP